MNGLGRFRTNCSKRWLLNTVDRLYELEYTVKTKRGLFEAFKVLHLRMLKWYSVLKNCFEIDDYNDALRWYACTHTVNSLFNDIYYIDSGWWGDQYCILSAEAVILVEAVGRDQYYLLRLIKYDIGRLNIHYLLHSSPKLLHF